METNVTNPSDGQHVVIQNGQRVTAPMESKAAADAEALRRNTLAESSGSTVPENKRATVKQNLCG